MTGLEGSENTGVDTTFDNFSAQSVPEPSSLVMATFAEVSEVLGLEISTASKRYVRALKRLQVVLEDVPGLLDGVR
jgi:hypothetical protein